MSETASPLAARLATRNTGAPSPLLRRPAAEPAPAPAAPPSKPVFDRSAGPRAPKGSRPNQYAGRCARCRGWVEAGAGLLGDKVDGKWTTVHIECPERVFERDPEFTPESLPIWPGIYTVVIEGEHRTFKVELQASDAAFAPGKLILSVLRGPDNLSDYTGLGFILAGPRLAVWKKQAEAAAAIKPWIDLLISEPEAALSAKHCARCNATLTTPDSIAMGLGPECRKKGFA